MRTYWHDKTVKYEGDQCIIDNYLVQTNKEIINVKKLCNLLDILYEIINIKNYVSAEMEYHEHNY
jgi:hypothetical protein